MLYIPYKTIHFIAKFPKNLKYSPENYTLVLRSRTTNETYVLDLVEESFEVGYYTSDVNTYDLAIPVDEYEYYIEENGNILDIGMLAIKIDESSVGEFSWAFSDDFWTGDFEYNPRHIIHNVHQKYKFYNA